VTENCESQGFHNTGSGGGWIAVVQAWALDHSFTSRPKIKIPNIASSSSPWTDYIGPTDLESLQGRHEDDRLGTPPLSHLVWKVLLNDNPGPSLGSPLTPLTARKSQNASLKSFFK
jgi:hypothetical protein